MLNRIAEELRQGRKVVLVHGNADMDALGSAYALSKAFPEADVYAPNGLDRVTRMVSEKMATGSWSSTHPPRSSWKGSRTSRETPSSSTTTSPQANGTSWTPSTAMTRGPPAAR